MMLYGFSVIKLFLIVTVSFLIGLPSFLCADQSGAAGAAEVAVEAETDGEFVYNPRGRRDPFTPLIRRDVPAPSIQVTRRPEELRGPLERYELQQLRLIAVMVVSGAPRAMVAAPDGRSYTVRIDDYVGINGGRVKDIQTRVMAIDDQGLRVERNPDRIVVEEVGVDSLTGRTIREERYIVL